MKTIATVPIAILLLVFGCDRGPAPDGAAPAILQDPEPAQDVVARFVATASDAQVLGYGIAKEEAGGPGLLFVLHVRELSQRRPLPDSYTKITEEEMGKVIRSMAARGFFEIPEKPTPDREDWRLCISGSPGLIERHITKQEFDRIVNDISEVLQKGFSIRGR